MALTKLNNQSIAALTDFNLSTDDLPAGSVLQVVQNRQSGVIAFGVGAFNAGSQIASCDITPISASSKILMQISYSAERTEGSGAISGTHYYYDNFYVGNTQLGSVGNQSIGNAVGHQFPGQARQHVAGSYLYQNNTTNTTTFSSKVSGGSNVNNTSWAFYGATFTLIEIAG